MSRDKWRFNPNEDYFDDYDNDGNEFRGNRKGFSKSNKPVHYRSDKFDGKRMKRNNHRRGEGKKW